MDVNRSLEQLHAMVDSVVDDEPTHEELDDVLDKLSELCDFELFSATLDREFASSKKRGLCNSLIPEGIGHQKTF
jgi:hypothetical protein